MVLGLNKKGERSLVVREMKGTSFVVIEMRLGPVFVNHLVHETVVGHLWVLVGGRVGVQEPWGRTAVYRMYLQTAQYFI